jgi:hypothetical protein
MCVYCPWACKAWFEATLLAYSLASCVLSLVTASSICVDWDAVQPNLIRLTDLVAGCPCIATKYSYVSYPSTTTITLLHFGDTLSALFRHL